MNLAALVEEILNPGARRVIGDEVEFVPEAVEFLLALFVEDQLHQRSIVAEVAHHVVIARAQQASLVLRIVREVAAALADIESVRENGSEARERGFIAGALGGWNYQIGIAGAGFRRERGPARSRFLMKPGIFRNFRHHRGRVGIVAQILGIAIAAVRGEFAQLPVQQGLRSGRQSSHHRRGELHRRVAADLDHEIAHLDAFRAQHIRLVCAGRRQSAPHSLELGDGTNRASWSFQNLPDHGQILRAHLRSAAMAASVACGFPRAARYLKRHAA